MATHNNEHSTEMSLQSKSILGSEICYVAISTSEHTSDDKIFPSESIIDEVISPEITIDNNDEKIYYFPFFCLFMYILLQIVTSIYTWIYTNKYQKEIMCSPVYYSALQATIDTSRYIDHKGHWRDYDIANMLYSNCIFSLIFAIMLIIAGLIRKCQCLFWIFVILVYIFVFTIYELIFLWNCPNMSPSIIYKFSWMTVIMNVVGPSSVVFFIQGIT